MLRSLLILIISLSMSVLIACSKNQPAPTAPAGKANCALCGFLGGEHSAQDGASDAAAAKEEDSTDSTQDTTGTTVTAKLFEIELLFAENVPQEDREIFRQAAAQWEEIILQGLPDIKLPFSIYGGHTILDKDRQIDDLLILVRNQPEDPSRIRWWGATGYAQILYTRPGGLPAVGQITYGEDSRALLEKNHSHTALNANSNGYPYTKDVDDFIDNEMLTMACHEIGHVLGIGTIDQWYSLVVESSHWSNPQEHHIFWNKGTDFEIENKVSYFFLGLDTFRGLERMRDAYSDYYLRSYNDNLNRSLYYGVSVPLEDDNHHWHGSLIEVGMDIMTSTLIGGETSSKYISSLTRGCLVDLGYDIDMSVEVRRATFGNAFEIIKEPSAAKRSASYPTFVCLMGTLGNDK